MRQSNVFLSGENVSLVPLSVDHKEALRKAVMDGELWKIWYAGVPSPSEMGSEIDRRLELSNQNSMIAFTVLDKEGKVCGMTSIYEINREHHRSRIGYTWYAKTVQRTALNKESKLLLLDYAFNVLEMNVVYFTTHRFNLPSRRAIESLGAQLDGILRNHMVLEDGTLRDTCCYSIISSEWPTIKRNLEWSITQKNKQSRYSDSLDERE